MSSLLHRICRSSKTLLKLARPNRGVLTFGIFLVLSSIFWLSTALNEYYDYEVSIPVAIDGMPKTTIPLTEMTDTVKVTVHDKGFALLNYTNTDIKPIRISFPTFSKQSGRCVVTATELHRLVAKRILSSSTITAVKPEKLDFSFAEGVAKRVPVRLNGKITAAESHYLAHTAVSPTWVTVYLPKAKADSVKYIATEKVAIDNVSDTLRQVVTLAAPAGVKLSQQQVTLTVCSDVLTEAEVEVPVTTMNVPEGITLRTFPSRVKVRYTVGVAAFRTINTSLFTVVADYNELASGKDKCQLHITRTPRGINKASLATSEVDYLIEQ